ncbi:hypothetical protein SH661x_001016 [Planctomicrobium sp. SH661]|uniref:hypothetical protein n=1 Tax=Planctomicrobium sp. SH661 TaxID=3448124 RepID=UPI003F5C079A
MPSQQLNVTKELFASGPHVSSSAGSNSASTLDCPKPTARSTRGLFIGMDEAGYGPNLGPLLIAVTCWQTPDAPHLCDFYRCLKKAVDLKGTARGKKLHIADSKAVNVGKLGFRSLETSALALLSCLGWTDLTFQSLWKRLTGTDASGFSVPSAPWYSDDLTLPVAACPDEIQEFAERLRSCMDKHEVQLLDIHADLVVEERFNSLVESNGNNKGLTLSRLAFQLLGRAWHPGETRRALFVGDKHGGRNRYDELLSEVLDGEMIFRLEEGRDLSRYRVRECELRFQVGGESHLPVACASIIAKYMRELAMDLFNLYWGRHCPDVKPTRGYPNDAIRFREQVEAMRTQLQVEDHLFWRIK